MAGFTCARCVVFLIVHVLEKKSSSKLEYTKALILYSRSLVSGSCALVFSMMLRRISMES